MEKGDKLTRAFNLICHDQPDQVQKKVSQRLKEYIECWDNDDYELDIARQTNTYYQKVQDPTSEDDVEYLVSSILIEVLAVN